MEQHKSNEKEKSEQFTSIYEFANKLATCFKIRQFNFTKQDFIKIRNIHPIAYRYATKAYNASSPEETRNIFQKCIEADFKEFLKENPNIDKTKLNLYEEYNIFQGFANKSLDGVSYLLQKIASYFHTLKFIPEYIVKSLMCAVLMHDISNHYKRMEKIKISSQQKENEQEDNKKVITEYNNEEYFIKDIHEHIMKDNFMKLDINNFNLMDILDEDSVDINAIDNSSFNTGLSNGVLFILGLILLKATVAIVIGLEIRRKLELIISALPGLLCGSMIIMFLGMVGNMIPFDETSSE